MPDLAAARQAKSRIMNTVLNPRDVRHVAAIGLRQQDDGWVVRVNLREDNDRTRKKIPSVVEGVPVVVEVTGSVHAHSTTTAVSAAGRAFSSATRLSYAWFLVVGAILMIIAAVATLIVLV
ncbi:hypothetical protein [Streptomyces griseorubiginosus]|uniref:hypothetical protein n=1 Tax=Streptomyces griseorubiginosus TaxID=67304 RepID=UPI003451A0EB